MSPDAVFGAFQEQTTVWLDWLGNRVDALPLPFAFGAGMLATINPCGFIMLPAFAAFYISADGSERGGGSVARLQRALVMGGIVTAAFIVTFGVTGMLITVGARFIMHWVAWAGLLVGLVLIAFGLAQLVTRRSLFAGMTAGVRVQRSRSVRGVALFGFAYAVASLGCTLPVFMIVAGSVFVGAGDFVPSAVRFVEYAAGMGAVLTAVTVGVALFRRQTTRAVGRALPYVDSAANLLLVFAGTYLVWYWTRDGGVL